MSKYSQIHSTFPKKCKQILVDSNIKDIYNNREVTHMLALSAMSISLPIERLQSQHPSREDREYPDSPKQLENLCKKKFLESPLYMGSGWYYDEWDGEDYFWEGKMATPTAIETYVKRPGSSFDVNRLLRHLRNALSHGNVLFSGQNDIEEIVFLNKRYSKVSKDLKKQCLETIKNISGSDADALRQAIEGVRSEEGYAYLMTSPEHFRNFLYKWLNFVSDLEVSDFRIRGNYPEAAD